MKRLSPPWLSCWIMDACLVIIFQYHSLVFVFYVAIFFIFIFICLPFHGVDLYLFDLRNLERCRTGSDDATVIASLLRRRVLFSLKHLLFLIHPIIVQRNKRSESADVTSESIAEVLKKLLELMVKIMLTSREKINKLAKAEVKQVGDKHFAVTFWIEKT